MDARMDAFLEQRKERSLYRQLSSSTLSIDFSTNDYLGLSKSSDLLIQAEILRKEYFGNQVGSTGSRLLNGHHSFIDKLESRIASFHNGEAALVFNSGYNANSGLLSTIARKGDLIIYDESIHASLHEGIKLSKADSVAFDHNSVEDLKSKLPIGHENVIVVTESVFSMDGSDSPLLEISNVCEKFGAYLIVDEAHGFGVRGVLGQGRCVELSIEKKCFARVYTYGKAGGAQGASVVGSETLKNYLINYCKSFIYTTAMSSHDYCRIMALYDFLSKSNNLAQELIARINYFKERVSPIEYQLTGTGPIFFVKVGDSHKTRRICKILNEKQLDLRPIVSPTVPKGQEGIRLILHSYNSMDEIDLLLDNLISIGKA